MIIDNTFTICKFLAFLILFLLESISISFEDAFDLEPVIATFKISLILMVVI